MRYERQLVLREWGTAGQAALEAACAELPCAGAELAVASRYLNAAGVTAVRGDVERAEREGPKAPFADALASLPWHASSSREVGVGAAHAVDFIARTLRGARR